LGNAAAIAAIESVFQVAAQFWRGIGELPNSGLVLRSEYAQFDARYRFEVVVSSSVNDGACQSGEILRGLKKPHECPAFGDTCTPDRPLGAPMVSSEGACAAYYRYRERQAVAAAV
jgi:hydrogenase expression/formation protein HypD